MAAPERRFEAYDPATGPLKEMPLLVGITGPSFSGKSYSAEELAAGMQKVYGGQIYHIDTENDRALELHKRYGGKFEFQHVPFRQPASPEQYEQVIRYCLAKPDCGVIIVDTMTHEHIALLNMMEEYMERKGAGDDWQKRDKLLFASMVVPKGQRKRLNELVAFGCVRPDGKKVPVILLYRAQDKTKPGKSKAEGGDGKPIHKGWQAETSSDLPFYMTARFLLPPGSDGHPNQNPDTEWERLAIKNPQQFRGWFKPGFQLTAEIGEKLARWAKGEAVAPATPRPPSPPEVNAALGAMHPARADAAFLAGEQAQAQTQGAQKPASGPPAAENGEKDEALKEALLVLQRLPNSDARKGAMQLHFAGAGGWSAVKALDVEAIEAGAASLARELDGLAAMKVPEQWLPSASDQEDQQPAERQPGEDDEEVTP